MGTKTDPNPNPNPEPEPGLGPRPGRDPGHEAQLKREPGPKPEPDPRVAGFQPCRAARWRSASIAAEQPRPAAVIA